MDPLETPLRRGLAAAKLAVDEDTRHKFQSAIHNYKQAVQLLSIAYRDPTTKPSVVQILPTKIREYYDRAKVLEEQQGKQANPPDDVPDGPSFGATIANSMVPSIINSQLVDFTSNTRHSTPIVQEEDEIEARFRKLRLAAEQAQLSAPAVIPAPSFATSTHPPASQANAPDSFMPKVNLQDPLPIIKPASPPPYIPDVVPEPNFIEPSSAFSSFHESMAPSAYQAGRPEDDMFFEGYKTTQSSQPFEEQTKQIINGRVYTRMGESNGMKPAESRSALQVSMLLIESAKAEDKAQNYPRAFLLYKKAIEIFVRVLQDDLNQTVRTSISKTVKEHMSRAEKLKEYLERTGELPPPDPELERFDAEAMPSIKMPPSQDPVVEDREDYDIRVGTVVKESSTKFWNDSSPLFVRADIHKNILYPGDSMIIKLFVQNRSGIKVPRFRIYLQRIETFTTVDLSAKKSIDTKKSPINPMLYAPPGKFPLMRDLWEGDVEYIIPADVKPTESDFSTSYAREYKILIVFEIPRHSDFWIEFPVRVMG